MDLLDRLSTELLSDVELLDLDVADDELELSLDSDVDRLSRFLFLDPLRDFRFEECEDEDLGIFEA